MRPGRRLFVAGGGGSAAFGARLIQPGAIAGGIVGFSRAQAAGAVSTAFNPAGDAVLYAADAPRFNGTAARLLLEGQRTNLTPNPRGEGFTAGVIGSGGVLPAGWALDIAAGLTWTIVGVGTQAGLPFFEIRAAGTTNATASVLRFMTPVTPLVGSSYTASAYLALAAGSTANITSITAGIAVTGGAGTNASPAYSLSAAWQRREIASVIGTGATAVSTRLILNHASGVAVDITLRIAAPQLELGAFASSPILPPAGTPGASTRGQDNTTSTFASLFPTGVGTVLASFLLPQNAVGEDQTLFEINDGSANNRIRMRNVAGGATLVAGRVIGGVSSDATTIGSHTPGALFRVGLTFDGSTIVANFNGGANQTVAGQPAGLTTLRDGNNAAGTAPMFGEVGYFDALPYVIPGANLPAAVSAIPG